MTVGDVLRRHSRLLRAMQIPLQRGRFFTDRDNLASTPVVVIDDVLARHIFPGQDPVGRQISLMVWGLSGSSA
jgi:flagella basal body P-ring formation protein FlgA